MRTIELLKLLSQGGRSVAEIAAQVGVDKKALMDRLSDLESMGYLKRLELGAGCGTGGCGNCPMRRSCGGSTAVPVVFVLSGKGKRMLEREDQPVF